ncbi:MAG: nuclear transport factor 2 family protein [Rhizobiales bacterium]|nr:nuclear transport factor 2 family protein [Hyphomicrobiales bacterium]
MSVSKNIEATQKLFEAFGAKDIPAIMTYLDPEIVIDFYGPDVIPYANHYEGTEEARRFFETVLSSVDINQFDAEDIFGAGDKVVVTGHLNLRALSTGRIIDSDFVHVITLRDERWLHFRDFMNSAVAAAAFAP